MDILSKNEFESLVLKEKEFSNSSSDSIRKELSANNLQEVGKIGSNDIGFDINEEVIAKIYKLEDAFLITLDTYEEDYSFYCSSIDEANKLATDKVFEYSN